MSALPRSTARQSRRNRVQAAVIFWRTKPFFV